MQASRNTTTAVAIILLSAGAALAQDSVADIPATGGDALSAYGAQRTRYVLDLVELSSSWNTSYFVGPLLKATRDGDPLFNTLALGASAASPDVLENVVFAGAVDYSLWTIRGAGVAPENTAPSAASISGYDRQFGVVASDLNADATNVIGAVIGMNGANVARLYVERVMAAQSRIAAVTADTGTLSVGSIDADGAAHLRADGFNGSGSNQIIGENLLRVDLLGRSGGLLNGVFESAGVNTSIDGSATTFLLNGGVVTTNTPAAMPASLGGSPRTLGLDFANSFTVDGGAGTTSHLASGIDAHRGNPTFAAIDALGGVGALGALARSSVGGGLADSLNVTALAADGSIVDARAATLPSPMPGFPSLNAAGDAEFLQYVSQTSFRGPNGLVAIGLDAALVEAMAAATATDPTAGQFIAVARFAVGAPVWTVAAYEGQPVLDGPGGATIGQLAAGTTESISAPGMDRLGNVYFVAEYDPALGSPHTGFFKAVYTGGAYQLELLIEEGDTFTGANSASGYTVDRLFLGDADSLASSAFHAGQVIQPQLAGKETTDPADSLAFGGAVVGAEISYNNLGSTESYQTLLFLGPYATPGPLCPGDVNGDGRTDVFDFGALAASFGQTVPPNTMGDLDGNGEVNVFDFGILASDFGCGA